METKTKFGFGSIAKHPPKWLVPALAVTIIITQVASFIITGDPVLSVDMKLRVNHYLNGLTMFVSLIAPLFGVDIKSKRS